MPLYSDHNIIDGQFRRLRNYSVKPSSRIWWRIASSLNVQKIKVFSKRTLFIAVLVLLTGTSAGLFETLHFSKSTVNIKSETVNDETKTMVLKGNDFAVDNSKDEEIGDASSGVPPSGSTRDSEISTALRIADANNSVHALNSDNIFQEELNPLFPRRDYIEADEFIATAAFRSPEYRSDLSLKPPAKYYYLGGVANLNSTWLIDSKSIKSDNLKYESTFGISYGIQGGYNFSSHWGLQVAWLVNSWEGQRYKNLDVYGRTTDLAYNQKSIALTYTQFPVVVQYKIPMYSRLLNIPVTLNLSFGGQFGQLLAFRIDDSKEGLQSNQLFRKSEFASVIGFDYDFFSKKPIFYSLGLRGTYSRSIFKSDAPNYFEFEEPHNFLIGLHGAVNFNLTR
ncbi:MAG: outer membrane beta-barrel protein [Chitinophagales bacterium]